MRVDDLVYREPPPTQTPLTRHNPLLPMTPGTGTAFRDVFGYLLCIIISLSMLACLGLYIAPACAELAATSGGTARCELETGAYIFGAAFVVITLYAGYRMCRILFPARSG